ncbi:unnamed protein product [Musa acuminata var. zebrina]
MATTFPSPPTLLPVKIQLPRTIAATARVAAVPSPPGDAKRRWWAPPSRTVPREVPVSEEPDATAEGESAAAAAGRSRLTAEKARVLRREMRATESWHDAMYRSAIASRLASPDQI